MEEDIKVLKQLKGKWRDIGFGDKMCVCTVREQIAIANVLKELEKLQKDNEALEYQLKRLHAENNNITRELLARTDKLNDIISKQVIRDKIEELKEEKYVSQSDDCDYVYNKGRHEVLKELLGE